MRSCIFLRLPRKTQKISDAVGFGEMGIKRFKRTLLILICLYVLSIISYAVRFG